VEELLKDVILRSSVKTKSKIEMVETLKAEGFFKMLYEADIIAQN
jgi:hypothetical protein